MTCIAGLYHSLESKVKTFGALLGAPDNFIPVLFGGLLGSMFSFLQFVASPVIGGLSDRYGRRPGLEKFIKFSIILLILQKKTPSKISAEWATLNFSFPVLLVTTFFIALSYVFW